MRHHTRLLGTLVVICGASLAGARATAQAPETITIPMELMAGRPVIRVTVNGQGPYAFVIAPEDQATVIDRELAEALKFKELVKEAEKAAEKADKAAKDLVKEAEKAAEKADKGMNTRGRTAPAATSTSQVTNGSTQATVLLQFAAAKNLPGIAVPVTVADVAHVIPEFANTTRPRGIVSLSLWKDQLVTLDYARWMVMLQPGALPEPNGKEIFPLTPERQLRLSLTIAEQSIDCHVDPLFPEGLLLPAAYAGALALDGQPKDWGALTTRAGTVKVKEEKLTTNLMLGPFEMKTPLVMLAENGEAAMVGTRWLGRFSITYDLANSRARLDRITLPMGGR